MPHFPIVLMPMAIRNQLEGRAPIAGSPHSMRSVSEQRQAPERSRLLVHQLFVGFGLLLVFIGIWSGKIGVLLLGGIMGGVLFYVGQRPYAPQQRELEREQQPRTPHDEYDFQMTDKEWKWEGIRLWLEKNQNPPDIFLPSPIRSRPEQHFAMMLHRFFPHNIITDRVIELFKRGNAYHPDFTFVEGDVGLYIDIEIDEPYSAKGIPTHYSQPDGTASDTQRNTYFLQKGWVVLRFSESQIVLYPEECCKFIARLVFQLTGNDTYWKQWSYAQPDLPLVAQWSKEEAEKMSLENYRQSYK